MPDPADLLTVARLLLNAGAAPPSDAQLRRAVSTAYYALFHKILRAAVQRFMGADQVGSAGYAILYRSFDHRHMRIICEALAVSKLKDTLKRQLGRDAVSPDMRNFAYAFPVLQDVRHLADYDPTALFQQSDVASLIDATEVAMADFDRAT
ncbi:MAG: hypothetical protein QOF22_2490, partial [Bradyrhizobium sp.]|nr:hypothetical protein [Bradyrhizobium sp.]